MTGVVVVALQAENLCQVSSAVVSVGYTLGHITSAYPHVFNALLFCRLRIRATRLQQVLFYATLDT